MPIIYTLIARPPSSPLIDSTHPAHTGNFATIAQKILANIPKAQQEDGQKVTFVFEGHTFNFRAERGLMFMCMCDESFGRSRPFQFLKDIIDTYFLMFSGEETVLEGATARSFKGVLLQKLKNYSEPTLPVANPVSGAIPHSASAAAAAASSAAASVSHIDDLGLAKMRLVKSELDSLATSAKSNIDKVIARGEAIESLMDRSGLLETHSQGFRKASTKLKRKLCWETFKLKLLMACIIAFVMYLLMAMYCGWDLAKCL